MSYKEIGGSSDSTPLEGMLLCGSEVGTEVEGIYKGFKMVPGHKGKGKQKCHTFDQSNGEPLAVLGFGLMDHILNNVEKGSQTRITYLGKVGDYHKCKVEVDDEQESPF
ncbi:hypothetical protein LCGC14_1374160 [marine sediment metagenome]|uniref:Uncharacterized protein n=1 Tax=marine sediment metagenome TaxID=412755 RepID=A0A0F9MJQ2_9ZZZZ